LQRITDEECQIIQSCCSENMLFELLKRVLTRFIEGREKCLFLFIHVLFICLLITTRPEMKPKAAAKVLIIDDFHPSFMERLSKNGVDVLYKPDFNLSIDFDLLRESEIVAVRSKVNFDKQLISRLPLLKCIARGGAGMDNIDEQSASENEIELLNAPEGNRDAVAEHCMGLLLSISNNIVKGNQEVKGFEWNREDNRGWEIGGKTIGIVGFGNTGEAFAQRLSSFKCNVLVYDKHKDLSHMEHINSVEIEDLLQLSDVISFHIPLSNENKLLINNELISKMKQGVVILNTSRGGIADTESMLHGIKRGKIKALGLDVIENENFKDLSENERNLYSDLMSNNQVIITPHVAGWSFESYKKIADVLSRKLLDFTTKMKNI
jgi:D-3-phosphoglycerate dehydrogenase / 2-oxoglutarate reductase